MRKNRFAALTAALILLLSACDAAPMTAGGTPPAGDIPAYVKPAGEPQNVCPRDCELDGHALVAENGSWELYLEAESLSIIMRDKASGAYMSSTVSEPNPADNQMWKGFYQSGVVLEYVQGTNVNTTRADLVYTENEKTLYYRDNGFSAEVRYPAIGISYTLNVTLEARGFTAEVPQSSMKEENDGFAIGALYLYPFMGYTTLGADAGYMLIPDGQGALIALEDNQKRFTTPYISYIYGDNAGLSAVTQSAAGSAVPPEKVLMPVYGMAHTEKGIAFLGIVDGGAENACIEAYPNGVNTQYDWISARFIYRHTYMQPTGQSSGTVQSRTPRPNRADARVRFAFTAGDNANYAGLASAYREYLDETGAFENAETTDIYRTQVNFFGGDRENWALFKLNVSMTGFDQAADILEDLADAGVTGLLSVYEGWRSGGATASVPTVDYSPASNLGGKSGMAALWRAAEKASALLFLNSDLYSANPDAHPFLSMDTLKRVTGRTHEQMLGGPVYGTLRYLAPPKSLEYAESAVKSFKKAGVYGINLSGTTNALSAYRYDGNYYDRADNAALYGELTALYAGAMPVVLSGAFANQWKYAAALTDMPMDGSKYIYTSAEVPFLSIALSGCMAVYAEYTNFQANQRDFFLKLVESGARPSFLVSAEDPALLQDTNVSYIYSSMYGLYREQIVSYDAQLRALHERIGGASIVGHERTGQTVKVTYDNGLTIRIDYDKLTYEVGV
ncbi:hypothetical protein FACS18949_13620 [Clostridia bacterium]|nr:hypothetical protein FACS18949_13620 [Clostridia bacterium]